MIFGFRVASSVKVWDKSVQNFMRGNLSFGGVFTALTTKCYKLPAKPRHGKEQQIIRYQN
jgi:hypothetical protein